MHDNSSDGIRQGRRMPMVHSLGDAGQRALARGQYVAAQSLLEQAEHQAWLGRDAAMLSRLYLPLLETCRQIRQLACEGFVLIADELNPAKVRRQLKVAGPLSPGLVLLPARGEALAKQLLANARSQGRVLEVALLLRHGAAWRLAALTAAQFAAGIPVRWESQARAVAAPNLDSADEPWACPVAMPGFYAAGSPLAVMTGEAVLLAFEMLALKWQARHSVSPQPWMELAWLRQARRLDPAAEPVLMRMIAVSQSLARQG